MYYSHALQASKLGGKKGLKFNPAHIFYYIEQPILIGVGTNDL
jgi:hypothetical protein